MAENISTFAASIGQRMEDRRTTQRNNISNMDPDDMKSMMMKQFENDNLKNANETDKKMLEAYSADAKTVGGPFRPQ